MISQTDLSLFDQVVYPWQRVELLDKRPVEWPDEIDDDFEEDGRNEKS